MFNTPKLIVSSFKIILQYYARSNWGSAVVGAQ